MSLAGAEGSALAADIHINSGTTVVSSPSDVGSSNVIVDNSADEDAVLQIAGSVTISNFITLNNGGTLINDGTIARSGSGNEGVYGDTGLATVRNEAGGTISVDDIGVYLRGGGDVVNTGAGSSINARIGLDLHGTSTVINELGAEINAGTGAGLYLTDSTVTN